MTLQSYAPMAVGPCDPVWSYGPMILMIWWSYDHMILWCYHPVFLWSHDLIIQWSCDPMILRLQDPMILWSRDRMTKRSCDHVIVWFYVPVILCSCDPMILLRVWSYGAMIRLVILLPRKARSVDPMPRKVGSLDPMILLSYDPGKVDAPTTQESWITWSYDPVI